MDMKRIILLALLVVAGTMIIWSQVPQAMNYKAVAKDDWGVALPNKTITLRFTILQGSETGSIVYQETHTTVTTKFGLMDVEIGKGTTVISSFDLIDWSTGVYYIRIEMDPNGGTNFRLEDPGHQLLSVPYALFAETSGSSNFSESDPFFTSSPSSGIWSSDIINWNSAFSWGNHENEGYLKSFTETDPIFLLHPAYGIASNHISNWNTAYSWGNHAGLYKPVDYFPEWDEITDKPTFASVATTGSYNDLTDKPIIDGSETTVTAGTNVTVTGAGTEGDPYVINSAGGGSTIPGNNPGDMMHWNGSAWVLLPVGSPGQVLTLIDGVPSWTGFGSAPVPDFKATPVSGTALLTSVSFTDLSTNLPTSWSWSFGDGHGSTLQNPSHVYLNAGIYNVGLEVSNIFGQNFEMKQEYITIVQSGTAPIAAFTANLTSGGPEMEVLFFDQSYNSPESWSWDFGDGGTSTERNPEYIYYSTGNFTVSLTVTNSYGSDTETKENYITVTEGDIPDIDIIFNPDLTYGTVTDIEGNTYKTIQIGTQTWMAENLKTTKFNDNTEIALVESETEWSGLTTPAYCWYNNNHSEYGNTYGPLYNWYVVNVITNGGKNVCSTGWHVPSDTEWTTLTTYLGGESVAGGKLKETDIKHWDSPNIGATNESGFTALPGGLRYDDFCYLHWGGHWWSSSECDDYFTAWFRGIGYLDGGVTRVDLHKKNGLSVRCVKD